MVKYLVRVGVGFDNIVIRELLKERNEVEMKYTIKSRNSKRRWSKSEKYNQQNSIHIDIFDPLVHLEMPVLKKSFSSEKYLQQKWSIMTLNKLSVSV